MRDSFSEFSSPRGGCHGNEWTKQRALRINHSRNLRNQPFHLTAIYAQESHVSGYPGIQGSPFFVQRKR
jgi:hypothetical protein